MVTRVTDLRKKGDYASLDDRMLVLDFQAGEPEAFVEIHRRYGPLARHVCVKFLPNRHDADDAFQETMIRVFQGLHRFNGRYALQPWIARIATNVSLDQIRTRTRRPLVEDGTIEEHERRDPAEGPEEILERFIERDLVLSVLSGLPETHRTALVLRELEGRSHREIAQALQITPAQAKALIHRAKGSFRRGWLLAITEKGGLAGIALLPLLWIARVADGVRRVVDRVGGHATQVAQAATPEIVSSAASSPPVVTAASSLSERVVAAGMTLLVAGGVTVGAATIVKDRGDHQQAARTVAAAPSVAAPAVQQPEPEVSKPAVAPVRSEAAKPDRATSKGKPEEDPTPAVVPPVDEATVSPSPETSPTPSPTPDPTIPPAPPWSLSFSSSVAVDAPGLEQVSSRVSGRAGQNVVFSQVASGPTVDPSGDEVGRLYLEYWGSTHGATGSVSFWIFLDTPDGRYRYDASGVLTSLNTQDDGGLVYVFEGAYRLVDWPGAAEGSDPSLDVPREGAITLTLGFWADATTLYHVDVGMEEFPASA